MAPRAYWKGYLRFSLVTCPIALYPASTSAEKTHFHQINKNNGHRLRQKLVDEVTGREVDKENRARGYELTKEKYVEIEEDELDTVKLESTHTIEIDEFVPADEIDLRYYDKPYYLIPNAKTGADAFVGRVVLASREHVIALRPLDKDLLGTTLLYPYELRVEDDYFDNIPSPRVSKDMIDLASHILDTKAAKFNPKTFKDKYENALRALVKRKASGKTIEAPDETQREDNVIDLMEALKGSLDRHSKKKAIKRPTGKRRRKAA